MHQPLRIELTDPVLAAALCRELHTFHADVVHLDDNVQVRVDLTMQNPDRRVADVLSRIDAWVARSGEKAVRIHLDGHVYMLGPAPESA